MVPEISLACVPTWLEDFRQDLARTDLPTLVIHGEDDRIVPFSSSGKRTAALIKGARLVTIHRGPHCVPWTHADQINPELVSFLGPAKAAGSAKPKKAVALTLWQALPHSRSGWAFAV